MACLIRLDNGQIFNISNKIDIIGRGSSASIFLDDEGVSRNHAEVFMMSGCVEIIDLNSRNGISINGKKVRKSFLNDGDRLGIGSVELVFSDETVASNQTLNMKVQDPSASSTHYPIAESSASGRMELIQVRPQDSFLKTGKSTLSGRHLELLFNASLEFNRYKGTRRLSEVVYQYVQKILTPSLILIKLTDELVIEKPMGIQDKIASELFESSFAKGVAFLKRKNAHQVDTSSVICSPILDTMKNSIGAIYIESPERNYEIEDLLFVRALVAQATGSFVNENVETIFLRPDTTQTFTTEQLTILGKSQPILHLKERVRTLAEEKSLMISGPIGTDRRIIANNIHFSSESSISKPFIFCDCSSLQPADVKETLFGRFGLKKGKFLEAEGGTLFLNRITSLEAPIQEMLSEYLETGMISPVDAPEGVPVSLRLIVGIRGLPERAVESKRISEEIYNAFKGKRLHIPPLKDRAEDIVEIANSFLKNCTAKYQKKGMTLAEASKEKLNNYPWPGNDRELELIIERAVLCCDKKELSPQYLALPEG